jgi:hypothetical protein
VLPKTPFVIPRGSYLSSLSRFTGTVLVLLLLLVAYSIHPCADYLDFMMSDNKSDHEFVVAKSPFCR